MSDFYCVGGHVVNLTHVWWIETKEEKTLIFHMTGGVYTVAVPFATAADLKAAIAGLKPRNPPSRCAYMPLSYARTS